MKQDRLVAAAITAGIFWGALMFIAALTAPAGWMNTWVALWADIYPGYGEGIVGAIVGLAWGFVDAAIAVIVIAWIYRGVVKLLPDRQRSQSRVLPRV